MKFNISNNSIFSENHVESMVSDMDNTDLGELYSDICPISGEVFKAMKEAAVDPENLKLTAIARSYGSTEPNKVYIEATEFANYVEATRYTLEEARDSILEYCERSTPQLDNAEFHVVFPSDCINKDILGGENLGKATANDWAMQLMRGCRRFGIKVNAGVEKGDPTVKMECGFGGVTQPTPSPDMDTKDQKDLDKKIANASKPAPGSTFKPVAQPSGGPAANNESALEDVMISKYNKLAKEIDSNAKKFSAGTDAMKVAMKNLTPEQAEEFIKKFKEATAKKKGNKYSKIEIKAETKSSDDDKKGDK